MRGVNETYASLLDGVFLSLLPPVQGFHIDAGDFAAVHRFDVSEGRVDGMEGVFHFAGFRVFPANQFGWTGGHLSDIFQYIFG